MDALISTADLHARLGAPDLRILDATYFLPEHGRDAAAEFAGAHVPGAAFLDLKTLADPSDPAPMMLPSPQAFADRLGALGVGQADRIVLYDDSPLRSSARAWWMLRLFGAEDVALLDGGLAKWRAEGRPLSPEASPPRPATFHARPDHRARRTLAQMRANLDTGAEQVLDARSAPRFTGEEPDPRPHVAEGHIPGSRNLHYAELFRPDGTWKRGDELRAAFRRAGVDLGRPLVTTCNSGVTAAVLLFGAHLLGAEGALYDGSWSEWGADPTTPKARGAPPSDPPRARLGEGDRASLLAWWRGKRPNRRVPRPRLATGEPAPVGDKPPACRLSTYAPSVRLRRPPPPWAPSEVPLRWDPVPGEELRGSTPQVRMGRNISMSDDADPARPRADATRVTAAGRRPEWTNGIVSPPVWRASTILYDSVASLRAAAGRDTHHRLFYGRRGTPTQWSLADALTELEPGAHATFLYPSGVAAVAAALLAVLRPGDELLLVDSAYDPTRAMAQGLLERMGITTRFYDPLVGAGIADLIGDRTRAVFTESPGSLTFEVQDVPAICAAAKARGCVTLIDNTWATPLHFRALEHGVDLSILACTKYVVGHSDVMLGSVTATPELWPRLRDTSFQLGQTASPDDAWLGARGLRTMSVRLKRHEASALRIAEWLEARPEIAEVLHPALPSHPGHALWARDFTGASGLFSFTLAGGADAARAALIDGLELFGIGYSWGGFESLALPVDPHRHRSVAKRPQAGPMVRLQIGLEDAGDLIADLEAGLGRWRAAT